jgi:hypothetical protein
MLKGGKKESGSSGLRPEVLGMLAMGQDRFGQQTCAWLARRLLS